MAGTTNRRRPLLALGFAHLKQASAIMASFVYHAANLHGVNVLNLEHVARDPRHRLTTVHGNAAALYR